MGNIRITVGIFLMDNDEAFALSVKKMLNERSNGVQFKFECGKNLVEDADVYILDHATIGTDHLLKIIKKIQKINDEARIVVLGQEPDGNLLKKIMKAGVGCFVDKTDKDIEPIFDEIKEEAENKFRVSKIEDGLQRLALAKNTLNQAIQAFG